MKMGKKATVIIGLGMMAIILCIGFALKCEYDKSIQYKKEHSWTHEGILTGYEISAGGYGTSSVTTFTFEDGTVVVIHGQHIDPEINLGLRYRISWYQDYNKRYQLTEFEKVK